MVFCVLFQDFNLMGDAVAVALAVVITGETNIESRPFFCSKVHAESLFIRLPFHCRPPFRQSPQLVFYDTIIIPKINK